MKNYKHIHGEYNDQEKLEIAQDKLSHAQIIVSRKGTNTISRQNYEKEVIELTQEVEDRTNELLAS